MEYETGFLFAAAILFLVDIVFLSRSKPDEKNMGRIGFLAAFFGFVLIITSYLLLLRAFLGDDFSFAAVYNFSSTSGSLLSNVYGSWAGAGGSMLFLTVILSVFYVSLKLSTLRKTEKFNISACQVFSFVVLVFLLVCLLMNPFERLAMVPLEGMGLNPELQSVWMAIHPPIVFSAYAFIVLAYVLSLAAVKTGREMDSSKLFTASTYIGWILLTLGIALGGIWAYEVLGWGGYWSWDPVETASLMPWLLLTAYFFTKTISKSKFSLTREFMIMVAFASLVFLSALTRGGFTQSVHSYALSAVGPLMLTFAAGMIGYFFYLKKARRLTLFKLTVDKSSLASRSFFVGFWALIFIAIICLAGLFVPNFAYSYWTFFFVLIFAISLIGFSLNEKTHYARVLIISLIALVAGAAVSIAGVFSGVNLLTTLTVPLLIVAFLLSMYGLVNSVRKKLPRAFGQGLLSVAIIILLLGVFLSAGAKTTTTIENVKPNTSVDAMQLSFQLSDLTISNSTTKVFNDQVGALIPEYSTIQTQVTVHQSGKTYDGTLAASFYPNYGLVLNPLIITTATGDIYLHMEFTEALYNSLTQTYVGNTTIPVEVSVTVQNSPMIYLVWGGVALMIVAMVVQFRNEVKHPEDTVKTV
jgi:cytochrome c biogenesis factor